ncbi:MAG: DUF3618 domain-containing protein [Streptosporangiaceae bacterium]|nr:DUF3618 domain-containing protein [Streptosporangiaceae bacterium]
MADADTAKPAAQDTLMAAIDRTRAELARTIDAIADRVSPRNNIRRAAERARQDASRAAERARQDASRAAERARQDASRIDPRLAGAAAAAVAVVAGALILWRLRRRT